MNYNYGNNKIRFHVSYGIEFTGIGLMISNKNPVADYDYFLIHLKLFALSTYLMIYKNKPIS